MDTAVSINNLIVRFGNNTIINNLNLKIQNGEIVGLLGPSGSGKTTLIKSIMGMNRFKGKINVFNTCIPSLKVMPCIGYMAQSDALYDDLSAMDNMLFFAGLFNIKGNMAKQKAYELLSFVELSEQKGKQVKNFSGGMKKRLSLAITLMHDPKLLILDEPTVGIDPLLRKKFWNEFYNLKENGHTILVTTHVMDEAHNCDKIILLYEGRIIAGGTMNEILENSKSTCIEDAFLYYCSKREGK